MTIWIDYIPRLIGIVLLGYAASFVPRNLVRVWMNARKDSWTRRRIMNAICWVGIVIGYIVSGIALSRFGWLYLRWAGYWFALAMLCFIPVPCHLTYMNTDTRWRVTRRILFTTAAALSVIVATA